MINPSKDKNKIEPAADEDVPSPRSTLSAEEVDQVVAAMLANMDEVVANIERAVEEAESIRLRARDEEGDEED